MSLAEVCLTTYAVLEIQECEWSDGLLLWLWVRAKQNYFCLKLTGFQKVRRVFSTHGAGRRAIHMQKCESQPLSYVTHKAKSQYIIDLNVRTKAITFLEENMRVNFCDLGLANVHLDMTPKAQAIKEKNR